MNQLAVLLWSKALYAEAEPLYRRALERHGAIEAWIIDDSLVRIIEARFVSVASPSRKRRSASRQAGMKRRPSRSYTNERDIM
jgi:hypothetical protein